MKKCCEDWLKAQFGDDRDTIEAVYAEYVETMSELAKQLAVARQGGDSAVLDRVLHTVKGSAAMAGDAELSELANRARGSLDASLLDAVAQRMSELA